MYILFTSYLLVVLFLLWIDREFIMENIRNIYQFTSFKAPFLMVSTIGTTISVVILSFYFSKGMPEYYDLIVTTIRDGFLCLFAWLATRGKYHILFQKINVWRGISIFSICFASGDCIASLMPIKDPQHLHAISLSLVRTFYDILGNVTVGIGEECLKLSCIVGVLSVFCWFSKKKSVLAVVLSCLITAMIFGYLHMFGWGITAGLVIAVSNVFTVLMIVLFKNIWVPMLAHFAFDTTATLNMYTHTNIQTSIALCCMVTTLFYLEIWYKNFKNKRRSAHAV